MINWAATKEESNIIEKIVSRFCDEYGVFENRSIWLMDIEATHCNGCPLKLQELLDAKKGDFLHDMHGIERHIDRTTGELQDCFLPRYSA